MFVGNGFARKGLRFLITAWPMIREDARLIVVGTDRAAASYERLVHRLGLNDRVKFLGRRNNVDRLMRGADLLALPSLFEPFGNVAMEAMASGVPVLTSAQSGVAELMPEPMREYIVNDPTDPEELSSRMNRLVEAASRAEKCRTRCGRAIYLGTPRKRIAPDHRRCRPGVRAKKSANLARLPPRFILLCHLATLSIHLHHLDEQSSLSVHCISPVR